MRNVRVLLAYEGSAFFGWQRQEGFPTVQAAVEEALESVSGTRPTVHGAGRTDTGVHAVGQVASFRTETALGDRRLLFALNAHLPASVVARALETCPDGFHAQRDARGKRYLYALSTAPFRPPHGRTLSHWVPHVLDVGRMRAAAAHLLGRHDFSAFCNAGSPRRSNTRRIASFHLIERRESLRFVVQGDGFLYNMVRTVVGTLLEIGRGKIPAQALPEILASRDRAAAGPTAPARGLFLVRVLYRGTCFGGPPRRRESRSAVGFNGPQPVKEKRPAKGGDGSS